MKKVFVVCGKQTAEDYRFWISAICTSKKKAEHTIKILDDADSSIYHYYFEEPVL